MLGPHDKTVLREGQMVPVLFKPLTSEYEYGSRSATRVHGVIIPRSKEFFKAFRKKRGAVDAYEPDKGFKKIKRRNGGL